MILRDRITVEHDAGEDTENVRAQVIPLRTSEKVNQNIGVQITSAHVNAYMHTEEDIESRGCKAIKWRDVRLQLVGVDEPWIDGAGRLYHSHGIFAHYLHSLRSDSQA